MSATAQVISEVQTVEGVRTCRVRMAPSRRVVQAVILSPPGARIDIGEGDRVHVSVAHNDIGAGVYIVGRFEAHGEADLVAVKAQVDALQAQLDGVVWLLNGAANSGGTVLYATPAVSGAATTALGTLLVSGYTTSTPAANKGRADDDAKAVKSFRVEIEGGGNG